MPPTPLDIYELTFRFQLRELTVPSDIAEFTLWMEGIGGSEFGDPQLLHAASGAVLAWQDNINQGRFSTAVFFGGVTARNFLANGHTNHEQTVAATSGWVGTADTASMPWETSLCQSLYCYPRGSFVANARSLRGRFYVPPMAASVLDPSNTGFFNNGDLPTFQSEIHDFLVGAQKDEEGAQIGNLVVYSRHLGEANHVVQISVDAKFDSQRRRQNREDVGHLEIAFP